MAAELRIPSFQGQLPSTDGSGCREAVISVAQAFDDAESKEEVAGLLQETESIGCCICPTALSAPRPKGGQRPASDV